MPQQTYRVRDPESGRTVVLRGDSPPTEQELIEVFAALPDQAAPPETPTAINTKDISVADTAKEGLSILGGVPGALVRQLASLPANLVTEISSVMESLGPRAGDPNALGPALAKRFLLDPAINQGQQAIQAGQEGRYGEAAGRGLAALTPGVGPVAATVMENLESGSPERITEGLGTALSIPAASQLPAMVRGTARVARAGGEALQNRAVGRFAARTPVGEKTTRSTVSYRDASNPQTYKNPDASQREIARTRLAQGTARNTEASVVRANAAQRAASARSGAVTRNPAYTMDARRAIEAADAKIAEMRASSAWTDAEIRAAVRRRDELARNWSTEQTSIRTRAAGETQVNPETAARVRAGQEQALTDMTNRPTMRQATARGTHRPGETFETVYPHRPPASQEGLNTLNAVPDAVRMGGRAGEMTPIRVESTTTVRPSQIPATQAQSFKANIASKHQGDFSKGPGASSRRGTAAGQVETAVENATRDWQRSNADMRGALDDFRRTTSAQEATHYGRRHPEHLPRWSDALDMRHPISGIERGLHRAYRLVVPEGGTSQALYNTGGAGARMASALESIGRVPGGNQAAVLAQILSLAGQTP